MTSDGYKGSGLFPAWILSQPETTMGFEIKCFICIAMGQFVLLLDQLKKQKQFIMSELVPYGE